LFISAAIPGSAEAVADDDPAARFRVLVLPELAYLQRLGVALTGNRQAGEDLVQECVLRALRYFDSYKGDGFRAWMAAIMRNVNRDRPRVNPVAVDDEWLQSIPDSAPNPEQLALNKDNASRLCSLVAGLPEALREVLVLREFGNLSYTQIAVTLQVPVGTVMSRLSRARGDLRTAWLANENGCAS
jgi:RNA polymerase sigma factor (sigma-70 family)